MGKSKVNLYNIDGSTQRDRLTTALRLLGLSEVNRSLDTISQRSLAEHFTPFDFLENLLEKEIAWREASRRLRWIQQAHFPGLRSIADFRFEDRPSVDRALVNELASCRFIENCQNIVLFGPTGMGKTHLAISFGIEAIDNGFEVRFLTLRELIDIVNKYIPKEQGEIRLTRMLLAPRLLILDEMDLYHVEPIVSRFLFRILYDRYEKGSVIFTSNHLFSQWGCLFGDKTSANKILDRINHHCTIININEGQSYRIKDKLNGQEKKV